jgi:hypothetical protein
VTHRTLPSYRATERSRGNVTYPLKMEIVPAT